MYVFVCMCVCKHTHKRVMSVMLELYCGPYPPHPTTLLQTLVLRLKKPPTDKKVQWEEGVVDNEFMGKKTSKCEAAISQGSMPPPTIPHYLGP